MVGVRRKCSACDCRLLIQHHTLSQSPLRPSAHGGWIGQACRIFAVWCGLLGRIAGGDPLASLLPAVKAVVPGWRQPIGQDREGLLARLDRFRAAPRCIRAGHRGSDAVAVRGR